MHQIYLYMENINIKLQKIEKFFGALALAVLFFVMIINAILRYLFQSGIAWSDELNGFLLVWFGFLAAAYTMSTDSHLNITAVISFLPLPVQYLLKQAMGLIQIVMFVIYLEPLMKLLQRLPISNVMRVQLEYVYVILPISFILMTYHILFNMLRNTVNLKNDLRGKEL